MAKKAAAARAKKSKAMTLKPVPLDHAKLKAKLDEELLEDLEELPDTVDRLLEHADPLDFADPSEVEHAVLMALTKTHGKRAQTWASSSTIGAGHVVDGSLHVKGDLTLSTHLFVLGNLEVDGAIHFTQPHCILAVGGKIQATHFESFRSYIHALEIDVAGLAHFRTCGHLWAIKKIKAKVLWDDDTQGYLDAEFETAEPTKRVGLAIRTKPDAKQEKKLEKLLGQKCPEDAFELFRALSANELSLEQQA